MIKHSTIEKLKLIHRKNNNKSRFSIDLFLNIYWFVLKNIYNFGNSIDEFKVYFSCSFSIMLLLYIFIYFIFITAILSRDQQWWIFKANLKSNFINLSRTCEDVRFSYFSDKMNNLFIMFYNSERHIVNSTITGFNLRFMRSFYLLGT